MAIFLDELKPLRLYRGQYYYPIDMKDRMHNSVVYLLTPNKQSSINLLNNKLAKLNNTLFMSYFIEKNVQFVINNTLSESSNLMINEEVMDFDYNLSNELDLFSKEDFLFTENAMSSDTNETKMRLFFPDFVDDILNEETSKTKHGTYNFSTIFKNMLFNERIKTQKECMLLYDEIRKEVPYIKHTFVDPRIYKNKNLFYDWSYYTEIYFKNNKYLADRGLDIYFAFLNRFIKDKRFFSYHKKTIILPVIDWIGEENKENQFDYKKTINPISLLWRTMRISPSLFSQWNDYLMVFLSDRGYFTIDFSNFNYSSDYNRFTSLIKNMIAGDYTESEEITKDSKNVIIQQLADKLTDGGIKVSNLTGGTKELTKDDLDKMGLLDNPNLSDNPEIKKAALINKLDKIASKSSTTDEAMKELDSENDKETEWLKDVLLDLQSDEGVKINAARASRIAKTKEELLTKEIKGKSVKKLLDEFKSNNNIEEESIPIDSIDEGWKKVKFTNFNKSYDMTADIVAMFSHFLNVTHPMNIINLKQEDTSTSEDYKTTWTCQYEDAETGKRFNMVLDIPNLISNRFMKLRGNEKILIGQLMLLPVTKTDEDTVQVVSNYNKIFVRRKSPSGLSKSTPIINKLAKSLTKYTGTDLKVVTGDNKKVCSRYELPMEFIDMACMFSKIIFKDDKSYISFNMDELSKIPIDTDVFPKDSPERKLSDEELSKEYLAIYVKNGKRIPILGLNVDHFILEEIRKHDTISLFEKQYQSATVAKRLMYSEASILNTDIPIVVILSYNIGLQRLLNKLNIKYSFKETRPSKGETYIKFSDGYLIFETETSAQNMLLNGLMECDMIDYSIKQINDKDMWLNILDDFGGRIKADGLDNFYDLMMDPVTVEICKTLNIPSDYVGALIYANDLLVDNKYNKHTDITGNRLRINEIIVGHLYQILSKAFGSYRNMVKRNKGKASFTSKQSAVIDSILNHDQTSSDLSTLTPLLEAEAASKVTFKGLSGMNSDRAFSIDKRTYDKSMLGVLGLSTGFAGTVGINRQTTINANVLNKRGFISAKKPKDLDNLSTFSIMEAMSPLAINHDDPIRTAMAFTQTAQHQMLVKKSMPSLITAGADEALPYLTSDKFSYKFKGKSGVVKEVTDDYIIVEDSDTHERDMIDLRETIRKNSDGGFYITTKLDANVKLGQKVKTNDILAYDKKSYSNAIGSGGDPNRLSYNIGTLAKVAIMNTDLGYEDSCVVDNSISEALESTICVQKDINLPRNSNIYNMVKIGQFIQEGEPLLVFQDAFDEKEANELLMSITMDNEEELTDLGRKQVRPKVTGTIQDIKIYRTCELDDLSPTLRKAVSDYEKKINKLKSVMTKNGINKQYTLEPTYKLPQEGKLKSVEGVLIEFYIKVNDKFGIGDKLVFSQALKGVNSYIVPKGEEPTTDYRKDEYVNAFLTISGVMGRMVSSSNTQGLTNKFIVELTRQCQEELGIKWRNLQEILLEE